MRTVVVTSPGVLELNWIWLPSWIGLNSIIKQRIQKELEEMVIGKACTEEFLDQVSDHVIDIIEEHCPGMVGVRDYLDGLKFVDIKLPNES